VDFIRSIDGKFEQYDDSGMSPIYYVAGADG
jgi:hypothetical protein